MSGTFLLALVIAPMLVPLVAVLLTQRRATLSGLLGATTAGAGFLGAVIMTVWFATGGDVIGVGGQVVGLRADRLGALLLLLVFGISAVVQAFALRYLRADPRAWWFVAGSNLVTATSAGIATAATLLTMALAWTVGSVGVCVLLAMYRQLPAARDGLRRSMIAFLIGDVALWTAVLLVSVRWGPVDLGEISAQLDGPAAAVAALLIVIAALSRSAQIPFHRWLPATLAAPTPVSALLHAGFVNAAGILLIRASPLTSTDIAVAATLVAGAATMIYGALIALTKPDVKGALVFSTMAQMGFMTLTAGLGLWAATVIHLVAHGCYKASLFLSSGSAIAHHRRHAAIPAAPPLSRRRQAAVVGAAVLLPLAALIAAALAIPAIGGHGSSLALLVFAWATGGAATWGWLQRRPGVTGTLTAAAVLAPAALAYLGIITVVHAFLLPALPAESSSPLGVWALAVTVLGILIGLAVLQRGSTGTTLHRAVYAHALNAGHLSPRPIGARL